MDNVADLLAAQLSSNHLHVLRRAASVAAERGVPIYLVGGAVRDVLLGISPVNLDLAVVRPGPDFASELAAELGGRVTSRSQFGTYKLAAGLATDGADDIDLTTARSERYPSPGALPVVEPSSLDDDLARRDFSVNAMAVSLDEEAWGGLADPFDGRRDLKAGVVRVLHERSFVDDATRVLRAVRYAVRLGFQIESDILRLLKRHLEYLDQISPDRVRHELDRILNEPAAAKTLKVANDLGILSAIHPALRFDPETGTEEPVWLSDGELPRSDVVIAALMFCSGRPGFEGLKARLNLDTRWSRAAEDAGAIKAASERLTAPRLTRSQLFGLLRSLQPSSIRGCALATKDASVRERLQLYLTELQGVRPLLNGDDLLALGVPEGPLVGELLEKLLTARLEGLLSTREDEESMAVRSLRGAVGEI